jgi:hypothetical protein
VFVAAVLRPEQREDGELEVVRLALQQVDDTVELLVCEAELAVELLFRDGAQAFSLAPASAHPGGAVVVRAGLRSGRRDRVDNVAG